MCAPNGNHSNRTHFCAKPFVPIAIKFCRRFTEICRSAHVRLLGMECDSHSMTAASLSSGTNFVFPHADHACTSCAVVCGVCVRVSVYVLCAGLGLNFIEFQMHFICARDPHDRGKVKFRYAV